MKFENTSLKVTKKRRTEMTDKDKIKFAICYLKLGLKSKRTPPLYEKLIQELGFEENDKVKELEKENAKLKTDYEVLSCSVGDFGELQDKLEEEQRKNNGLSDQLIKAKDILQRLMESQPSPSSMYEEIDLIGWREVNKEAEQFLKEASE